MLVQPQRTPCFALLDGVTQNGIVVHPYFRMAPRMVQMNGQRLELQVAAADPGVVQAGGDLIVFAAPADERLVETVDPHKIALPVSLVATPDGTLTGPLLEHQAAEQQAADGVPAPANTSCEKSEIEAA